MRVSLFIDIANGFSAGQKFVCSVTQYGSRFIRQAFRIEAWLMTLSDTTVDDLTPISGSTHSGWGGGRREGMRGGIVMIDSPSRQDDILTCREGGKVVWMEERKAGNWRKPKRKKQRGRFISVVRVSQPLDAETLNTEWRKHGSHPHLAITDPEEHIHTFTLLRMIEHYHQTQRQSGWLQTKDNSHNPGSQTGSQTEDWKYKVYDFHRETSLCLSLYELSHISPSTLRPFSSLWASALATWKQTAKHF